MRALGCPTKYTYISLKEIRQWKSSSIQRLGGPKMQLICWRADMWVSGSESLIGKALAGSSVASVFPVRRESKQEKQGGHDTRQL